MHWTQVGLRRGLTSSTWTSSLPISSSRRLAGSSLQAWLHHVQPVGDAQGSASRYRGRGNCRYVGEAARRACDADCLIKGFAPLQDVVFETTGPPPIHSAQPCHVQAVADRGPRTYGHSCMHLTALGLTSRWSRFSGTSSMSRFGP